jgi:CRP/FNR family transcriptional regulator, dissimilatory nitrate respiration regulator
MAQDVGTILQGCGLFAAVRGASRDSLAAIATRREYAAGQLIYSQGDECPGVFVVGEGLVRVYKMAPDGREHVLTMVGPGAVFAEVAAIGGFPCPAFAEAVEDSACALLPAARFRALLREDHDLCLQLLTGMANWVHQLIGMVESITLRDALARVAAHLLAAPADADGAVRLPGLKKHLASHLNLSSETLSRCLRRLADQGAIESSGERVRVLDRALLSGLAAGG